MWTNGLLIDVRLALRLLWRTPGFFLLAVFSLALPIGANTALFSGVRGLLLEPLPVKDAERLIELYTSDFSGPPFGLSSYPDILEFRREPHAIRDIAAQTAFDATVTISGLTERAPGAVVTDNYFALLGIQASLGRTFVPEASGTPASAQVAVLSDSLWRRMGAPATVVGSDVIVNGAAFSVLGVAPRGFEGTQLGRSAEIWVPAQALASVISGSRALVQRSARRWFVVAHVAEGVSLNDAQGEMDRIAARLAQTFPPAWTDVRTLPRRITVVPAGRTPPTMRAQVGRFLTILFGAVGLVLVIAAANVANLMIARTVNRTKDFAVRLSVGASRWRLIRQVLAESLAISCVAGVVGMALAVWLLRLAAPLTSSAASPLPFTPGVDLQVLLFGLVLAVAAGLSFGIMPAIQSARATLMPMLKGSLAGKRRRAPLAQTFVVVQVSLSFVLLVAAGLLVRTVLEVQKIDVGFNAEQVSIATIDASATRLAPAAQAAIFTSVLERLGQLPGVESASLASAVPLGLGLARTGVVAEGHQPAPGEDIEHYVSAVSPDYFRTLKIPVVRGRGFSDADDAGAPRVAVVNQAFARRFWPGMDAVGKRIQMVGPQGVSVEVVGVIADGRYVNVFDEPAPYFFLPLAQYHVPIVTVHVRSRGGDESMNDIRQTIRVIAPGIPLYNEGSLAATVSANLLPQRLAASWLIGFGFVALVLAAVGLYGMLTDAVNRQRREIGIRVALGADARRVRQLFLAAGLRMLAAGTLLGILAAILVTKALSALLYGVGPADPVAFAAAALVLIGVACVAMLPPAHRASKVDPVQLLRSA